MGKKRQHIKVPLISIVDDDRSVVEAMVSLMQSVGYKAKGFLSAEDFCKPFSQESLFQAVHSALANQHDIQHKS